MRDEDSNQHVTEKNMQPAPTHDGFGRQARRLDGDVKQELQGHAAGEDPSVEVTGIAQGVSIDVDQPEQRGRDHRDCARWTPFGATQAAELSDQSWAVTECVECHVLQFEVRAAVSVRSERCVSLAGVSRRAGVAPGSVPYFRTEPDERRHADR